MQCNPAAVVVDGNKLCSSQYAVLKHVFTNMLVPKPWHATFGGQCRVFASIHSRRVLVAEQLVLLLKLTFEWLSLIWQQHIAAVACKPVQQVQ